MLVPAFRALHSLGPGYLEERLSPHASAYALRIPSEPLLSGKGVGSVEESGVLCWSTALPSFQVQVGGKAEEAGKWRQVVGSSTNLPSILRHLFMPQLHGQYGPKYEWPKEKGDAH